MVIKQRCDLCNSTKFEILIDRKGPSMLSDRKIIKKNLKKIECMNCGLVCNSQMFEKIKIKENYEKNYSYNPSEKGDTFFFSDSGSTERSTQIFEWILENISKEKLEKAKSIIEVGCGQGNLLSKFFKKFPEKEIIGLELNRDAIKIGKKKGLDIRDLAKSKNLKADIIISYAVIEHTPSPKKFLRTLANHLNSNGLLIIGQPNQDKIYYDIFFWDHLFHFSSKHIDDLGRQVNLLPIKKSKGKWPVDSFSLHVFKKSNRKIKPKIAFHKTKIRNSIKYYEKIFDKINKFLKKNSKEGLAVLGLGEIFSIFYTYTDQN
jgi:2-polyprenyl-3-methyl-5-hydroxy-6-metoxy-1,4-benzoquinol methylase